MLIHVAMQSNNDLNADMEKRYQ